MLKTSYYLLISFFLFTQLIAQVPQKMSYQGVLTDSDGNLVADGTYTMNFRLYTIAEGGKALWVESQVVQISNGIFNVNLGEINPLNSKFDRQYWLGIGVNSAAEMLPTYSINRIGLQPKCKKRE